MTALLVVAAFVLVGWFAGGTVVNVRKGSALMRWMQQALPKIGGRTTVRWLGSTAVEMVIEEARAPFSRFTTVIFLEPRDMPWMWALARRQDTLILRGDLRREPRVDFEAVDAQSWSGREVLGRVEKTGERDGFTICGDPCDELIALARGCGLPVRRLSVRRTAPHLQLHVGVPADGASADALFDAMRALGERAAHQA
jgi:hypothetical protein